MTGQHDQEHLLMGGGQGGGGAMKKWEYGRSRRKVSDSQDEARWPMNAAGAEGWELVSVVLLHDGWLLAFFKRPIPEASDYKETPGE